VRPLLSDELKCGELGQVMPYETDFICLPNSIYFNMGWRVYKERDKLFIALFGENGLTYLVGSAP